MFGRGKNGGFQQIGSWDIEREGWKPELKKVPEEEIELQEGRAGFRNEETHRGVVLKRINTCMISISCRFLCFHIILLCLLCIMGFYFDVWMWALEAFAHFYRIWVCLYPFYAWFLTGFSRLYFEILYEILAFISWFLFETHLRSILDHPYI